MQVLSSRWVWCNLGLALSLLSVSGMELNDYLRLRRQNAVNGVTPTGALEIIVGKKVIEIEGVIRGIASSEGQHSVLIALPDSRSLVVLTNHLESWFRNGQVPVRALIQVERQNEVESGTYRLLGAVPKGEMQRWEAEEGARLARLAQERAWQAPQAQQSPRASGTKLTSRSGTTATRQSSKSASASSGSGKNVDWNYFASHLEEFYPEYYQYIRRVNPRLKPEEAEAITRALLNYSTHYGVDPRFILAIMIAESGINPKATSSKGAMGLGQLMPGTAKGMGVVNPYDPVENLGASVKIVRGHLEKYWRQSGDPNSWEHVMLTLAAYNAGSGAVRKHGGVPPYKETQRYIEKVIRIYKELCGIK